jgi:hypothetical protein
MFILKTVVEVLFLYVHILDMGVFNEIQVFLGVCSSLLERNY